MFQLIGKFINCFYDVIKNYAIVLIIIGFIVSFISSMIKSFNKIKYYKIIQNNKTELDRINNSELSDLEKNQQIYNLYKSNNYNPITTTIVNVITTILSLLIFIVLFNPAKYIGINESFTQSFLYYDNIFNSSIDFIIPIIVAFIYTISPELGKPKNMLDFKSISSQLFINMFVYLVFGCCLKHVYIIYFLGTSLGSFVSNLLLIKKRRNLL